MRSLLRGLAGLLLFCATAMAGSPEPVSPGRTGPLALTVESCPTFSWSAVAGAWGYELAIHAVPEEAEAPNEGPVFTAEIPAGATSWTPSFDRCLEPGRDYVWFIREKGAFGRPDGAWSRGLRFEVDGTGDADVKALLEELKRLETTIAQQRPGIPVPAGVIEDVQNVVEHIRSRVESIFSTTGVISTRVLDVQGKLNEVRDVAAQLVTILATWATAVTSDIRDAILDAVGEIRDFLIAAAEGRAAFLGSNNCGVPSPCATFRADMVGLLTDLGDVAGALSDPFSSTPPASPFNLTPVIRFIQNAPGRLLYPIYQALSNSGAIFSRTSPRVEVTGASGRVEVQTVATSIQKLKAGLEALRPVVTMSCSDVALHSDTISANATIVSGVGIVLKIIGKFFDFIGETHLDSKIGVHGYPGILIKNNFPKKIGAIAGGAADAVGQIASFMSGKVRHCLLLTGQDALSAKLTTQKTTLDGLVTGQESLSQNAAGQAAMLGNVLAGQQDILHNIRTVDTGRSMEYQVATCQGLVSLFLPQAFGGSLEKVVDLVAASIANSASAGLDTKAATSFFQKAEQDIAAKKYPKAFDSLCKAYQSLTLVSQGG